MLYVAGPRILEMIYPIGRRECDEKVGRKLAGTKGGLSVSTRKVKAGGPKSIIPMLVKHAGKKTM